MGQFGQWLSECVFSDLQITVGNSYLPCPPWSGCPDCRTILSPVTFWKQKSKLLYLMISLSTYIKIWYFTPNFYISWYFTPVFWVLISEVDETLNKLFRLSVNSVLFYFLFLNHKQIRYLLTDVLTFYEYRIICRRPIRHYPISQEFDHNYIYITLVNYQSLLLSLTACFS